VPRSIRPLLASCALCAIALLAPGGAAAQAPAPVEINGSPLNVWTDADGSVQVAVDGYTSSEWFPPSTSDPNTFETIASPVANKGFGLVVDPANGGRIFGRFLTGSMGTPTSGPTLAPGNPATITTTWQLPDSTDPRLEVTQVLSYTTGSREFTGTYSVKNLTSSPVTFRASVAGDMAIRGSDSGVGFISPGPPRYIGGLNQEVGAAGGFVEITPWSHYEVGQYGTVRTHAADSTLAGGMNDTLVSEPVDNGAGVQWDDHFENGLAPGDTAVYSVAERYIDTLGISPPTSHKFTGEDASLDVSAGDVSGSALKNKTIDYRIDGANTQSGKVKTNDKGDATISYVGGIPGTDIVTAFVDSNGNSTRDQNEPQAQATIEWEGPAPPVIGQSAGVRPVTGKVKIKLPNGTSAGKAKALGLTGAASGFVPLTAAKQVPMGSTLDTSKGTVKLLTAATKNPGVTKFQSGNFNGGQFRVTQTKKNPLTQLSMGGGGFGSCKTRVPKGGSAARKHRRKLFGNAHGSFRTRGRNSSATVRGTKWSMTDTCSGTLTAVSRGTVVVRDFTLKKNKTVKAGHRYFARAPKLHRRGGRKH
jgi:hypothetical protein